MTDYRPSMGDVRAICEQWDLGYMADEIDQRDGGMLFAPYRKLNEREAFCMVRIWAVLYTPEFRTQCGWDAFYDYDDERDAAHLVRCLTRGTLVRIT